jgi:hypothetical protein
VLGRTVAVCGSTESKRLVVRNAVIMTKFPMTCKRKKTPGGDDDPKTGLPKPNPSHIP